MPWSSLKDKKDLRREVVQIVCDQVLDCARKELIEHCLKCEHSRSGKPCRAYKRHSLIMAEAYIEEMARWN